jgi:hypothetical protein
MSDLLFSCRRLTRRLLAVRTGHHFWSRYYCRPSNCLNNDYSLTLQLKQRPWTLIRYDTAYSFCVTGLGGGQIIQNVAPPNERFDHWLLSLRATVDNIWRTFRVECRREDVMEEAFKGGLY